MPSSFQKIWEGNLIKMKFSTKIFGKRTAFVLIFQSSFSNQAPIWFLRNEKIKTWVLSWKPWKRDTKKSDLGRLLSICTLKKQTLWKH